MEFSFERPDAFWALLLIIPALLYVFYRYRGLSRYLRGFYGSAQTEASYAIRRFRNGVFLRCLCNTLGWIMLVCAYAGFSWGTTSVPVPKDGNAVALVFDISWSMNTRDAPEKLTRLEAAARYASVLLNHMAGYSVSVVLVKGEGVITIPLTEDTETVRSLLGSLSPSMMTAPGTSLGKGIRTAIRSFPQNLSQSANILVFTDGDETDGQLSGALSDTLKYGIPVILIGFGSERETEIITGDGKTYVKTALRAAYMKKIIAATMKKTGIQKYFPEHAHVQYIDATEPGSAVKILRSVTRGGSDAGSKGTLLSYETQKVHRQGIFLGTGLMFFLLGFIFSEFDIHAFYKNIRNRKTAEHITEITLCIFLLCTVSCKMNIDDSKHILQSSWAWHQKNYRKAVAGFLQTEENAAARHDTQMQQYALYGLASTYLMQGENAAAMERLENITPDAPPAIRFAAYYNAGILASRDGNYQKAVYFFRKALLEDSTNVDAKINLELSIRQQQIRQVQSGQQESTAIQENSDRVSGIEKAVFSRIREDEQKQWRNQSSEQKNSSVIDY